MTGWLELSELEIIKRTITDELIKIGVTVSIDSWIMGEMAYDILEFKKDNQKYHLFASCRKEKSFGFGLCKLPMYEPLYNDTIQFDNSFEIKLHNILRTI